MLMNINPDIPWSQYKATDSELEYRPSN